MLGDAQDPWLNIAVSRFVKVTFVGQHSISEAIQACDVVLGAGTEAHLAASHVGPESNYQARTFLHLCGLEPMQDHVFSGAVPHSRLRGWHNNMDREGMESRLANEGSPPNGQSQHWARPHPFGSASAVQARSSISPSEARGSAPSERPGTPDGLSDPCHLHALGPSSTEPEGNHLCHRSASLAGQQ